MSAPKLPAGLGAAGREQWKRLAADVAPGWELDSRDLVLLEAACKAADRVDELDRLVAKQGLMSEGSTGQQRLHPAIGEARRQRAQVKVMLESVELAPPTRARTHVPRRELHRVDHGSA